MGRKPRRAPRDVPDSLPKRDEGTDVLPDDVRSTDAPQKGRIRRPYVRSDKTKSRRFAYCAYLSENLDRPLPTKDGGTLRTIHAACDDMTSIGNQRERRQQWQRACNLILAKANVVTVSRALELALFMDAKLEVSKVPAK